MRIDHFLVLGAGASFGARDESRPPLGDELAEYLHAWLDHNQPRHQRDLDMQNPRCATAPSGELWEKGRDDRLRKFLECAHRLDFESAADALWRRDRALPASAEGLIEPLNRLVAWSMLVGHCCRFPARRDRYDDLLALPRFQNNIAIITLNYDLLVEEALGRAGRPRHYPGVRPRQAGGLPVFKLHGSINWLQSPPYVRSATQAVVEDMARTHLPIVVSGPNSGPETQQEYVIEDRPNLILRLKQKNVASSPVLAVFARGKPVPYNYESVASVHRECLDAIASNPGASATVIGVGLPEVGDDPRLDDVLAALPPEGVEYVGGCKDGERAKQRGFKFVARTMEEFINSTSLPGVGGSGTVS